MSCRLLVETSLPVDKIARRCGIALERNGVIGRAECSMSNFLTPASPSKTPPQSPPEIPHSSD
jgi:hypothetical protein